MTDPNPDICGKGVQYLLDKGVKVDFFDLDFITKIREANAGFSDYWTNGESIGLASPELEGASTKEVEVLPHVFSRNVFRGSNRLLPRPKKHTSSFRNF
jgi:hypothetical protein